MAPREVVTGDLSGAPEQTVWEYRNPRAGTAGWGRVARATTAPTHCRRIVVMATHYSAWSNAQALA